MSKTEPKTKESKNTQKAPAASKPTASEATAHDHAGHTHTHDEPKQSPLVAPNSQVTVTIPWKIVEPAYQKNLQKLAQRIKAPGFRVGKVPATMAEKMIDPAKVLDPTIQDILPAAYMAELKKQNKTPITQPEIDPIQMEKGQDWIFTVYFAERPEVKLGEYQKVVKQAIKDADKEIAELDKKTAEEAKAKEKEAAKDTKDDQKKDDQKTTEEGKTTAPKAPEAKPLTDTQKEDMRSRFIFRALIEKIQPKIPELLIRSEVNRDLQNLVNQLKQLNLAVEDYLKSRQMTPDQLRQESAQTALTSLQIEFILAEIARDQKLTVDDKEIDEALDKTFGGKDKVTKEQRENPDYRSYVFSSLIKQKTVQFLQKIG
jgi:FKBP-type peptidyl-prolyl cis-trans isomerase (trigger factor)